MSIASAWDERPPTADYHTSGAAVATYAVSPDDQRFYKIRATARGDQSRATVVLNFVEEIRRLAPS